MSEVPEPLGEFIHDYWNIHVAAYAGTLHSAIQRGQLDPTLVRTFRAQLARAILTPLVTATEYNALTGDNEFTTVEQVQAELREFWYAVFPGEEPESAEI